MSLKSPDQSTLIKAIKKHPSLTRRKVYWALTFLPEYQKLDKPSKAKFYAMIIYQALGRWKI